MNTTINKAIVAFLTSFVALLTATGVATPGWLTPQIIEHVGTIGGWAFALLGAGGIGWLTWLIPNRKE